MARDAFTYTALLSACQAGGRWQQALEWFAELEAGAKAARSTAVADAAAVPAKAAAGPGEKGGAARRRPPRGSPPRPNVVHYTTLMTVLQRAGQWEQVRVGRACWKQEEHVLMGLYCCCTPTPAGMLHGIAMCVRLACRGHKRTPASGHLGAPRGTLPCSIVLDIYVASGHAPVI